MQQKYLVIIGGIILVSAASLYFFLNKPTRSTQTQQQTETKIQTNSSSDTTDNTVENGTSSLAFDPTTLSGTSGNSLITVQSGTKNITGIQLEIKFDPQAIESLDFSVPSSSVFGKEGNYIVLFNKVDLQQGVATYAIAINLGQDPVKGTGDVVNMAYTLKSAQSTSIEITKKSIVTEFGNSTSVLREVSTLSINN